MGWTPLTIAGSAKRTLGILHNPLYVGRLLWNRSQKVRDPDTGKRTMRPRPESEWMETQAPDLRIVPQELWDVVQAIREGKRSLKAFGRRTPKYLLSGLMKCAECGSHYTIQTADRYGCAAHADRGPSICSNGKLVRRDKVEEAIIRLVSEELFSPETLAYLTDRVNRALARRTMPPEALRKQKQAELDQARMELTNIGKALFQGIVTPTTKRMLLEAEEKVAALAGCGKSRLRSQQITCVTL